MTAAAKSVREKAFSIEVTDEHGTNRGKFVWPSTGSNLTLDYATEAPSHPADAALQFGIARGFGPLRRQQFQDEVCAALSAQCGKRGRGLIASLPVSLDGSIVMGDLELLDGQEAADVAHAFVHAPAANMPPGAELQLRAALCDLAKARLGADPTHDPEVGPKVGGYNGCGRTRALAYEAPIGWRGLPERLEILVGDEPADVLHRLLVLKHGRPLEDYRNLADLICYFATHQAPGSLGPGHRWTAPFAGPNADPNATLRAGWGLSREDGKEPLGGDPTGDANRSTEFEARGWWPFLACRRRRFVVQRVPVGGAAGGVVGEIEVLEGQEVADAVYAFAHTHGLPAATKRQALLHVCEQRTSLGLPPCTRDLALLVNAHHLRKEPMGSVGSGASVASSPLLVWENEDPADAIHAWCINMGVGEARRDELINLVCDGALFFNGVGDTSGGLGSGLPIKCKRRRPIILNIPLSNEHGQPLGLFSLLAGEEPADAALAFASRNNVGPNFRRALLDTLCHNLAYKLTCTRTRAYILKSPLEAHAGYAGPWHADKDYPGCYPYDLEIWEDEEPADAVFRFCRTRVPGGCPLAHRQRSLFLLCNDPNLGLRCGRPIPALFELSPVLDEKGGSKGSVVVLEGERAADALLAYLKDSKLAQVFKHPNLRRRLFHRLCSAAAEAFEEEKAQVEKALNLAGPFSGAGGGSTVASLIDCSVEVPRLVAVSVELTYMGIKSHLRYFFPDAHPDPLYPAHVEWSRGASDNGPQARLGTSSGLSRGASKGGWRQCVPLPSGLEPLGEEEEAAVARYGYDQATVDATNRTWLQGFGPGSTQGGPGSEETRPRALPTEAATGCLGPTRRAAFYFCSRLEPPPQNCIRDIHAGLLSHLMKDDNSRWIKAGPVGIDYYQMLRCPNDAPLPEVEARMVAVGREVAGLVSDVSQRVALVVERSGEGRRAVDEATQATQGTKANLGAAAALLKAAAHALTAAKASLQATVESGRAADAALWGAVQVSEGLRGRLLQACNATILRRNCSRTTHLVPLSSFEDTGDPSEMARALAEEAYDSAGELPGAGPRAGGQAGGRSNLDQLRRRYEEGAAAPAGPEGPAAGEQSKAAKVGSEETRAAPKSTRSVSAGEAASATGGVAGRVDFESAGGSGRLVPHRVWKVCLEREPAARGDPAGGGGTSSYASAVEGCELLARNASWVCPDAQTRLPGLLPRYPIEAALSVVGPLLASYRASIEAASGALGSVRAATDAARKALEAGRAQRWIGAAALRSASRALLEANATTNHLQDSGELEKAKHRSWAMERAGFDLTEGKNREFYDKPCRPVFGACCARDQADGGMNIICDGG